MADFHDQDVVDNLEKDLGHLVAHAFKARNIPTDDAQIVNLAKLSHTGVKVVLQNCTYWYIFNLYLNP